MIDLHVHSFVSDGYNSPREIIKLAHEKNLKAIALTDHDSIEGLKEAEEEAQKYKVKFLKGIEISTAYGDGGLLHILGLGIDTNNEYFLGCYNKMRIAREEGIDEVLEILKKKNISIKIEDLKKYAIGKYIDRHAITKYFVENKICDTVPEVWHDYLDPIPYGKGELLEIEETLEVIRKSGGLSFLAHYNKRIGFGRYNKYDIEEHIKSLITLGLDGIERYYPAFDEKDNEFAQYIIDKYKLIPSGGTDFHGIYRKEIALGTGEGDFFVPDSIYENIVNKLHNKF